MSSLQPNDISGAVAALKSFTGDGFNAVQTAVVVVDHQGGVLGINAAARELLGLGAGFSHAGLVCHQLLCGSASPCEDCLLRSPSASPKSHAIQSHSGRELFIREELLRLSDVNVLILLDVTREITSLRNLDMARKELKAKTILLERRRQVASEDKKRIEQMFDQLPDAFVQVDSDYRILYKNKSVSDILSNDSVGTCYELLGKQAPCSECPLRQGPVHAGGRKVIHREAGRCFTELVIQSADEEAPLLLFSDTTRQIELIEKIREQRETISRKNEILSNLVSLQTRMQKAIVTTDMINYFLDMFLPLCGVEKALIIIDDVRPGSVWFVVPRGLDQAQASPVVRNYLSREVQRMDARRVSAACLPWKGVRQMELTGGNGRPVGIVIFPDAETAGEGDLIRLFSEPFGAFVHNRLLLRQLEEKANTDPLTGLYNRRYLEGALAAEKEKSDQFGMAYSVIVVDVNRLKEANDRYGHDVGDRLLLTVSERLKTSIRTTDAVARTGGDEFLLLLSDTREAGARNLAERLLKKVFNGITIETGGDDAFPVSVSLGLAGSDAVRHEELLQTADRRMYEAKQEYYRTHQKYR